MRRQSGEERASTFIAKSATTDRADCSATNPKRAMSNGWRGKKETVVVHLGANFSPALDKRPHQLIPGRPVDAERSTVLSKIAFQDHRRAVVERMRQRGGRMNPLQTVTGQWQRRKKWRRLRQADKRPIRNRAESRAKLIPACAQRRRASTAPPGRPPASPACARTMAAAKPFGPAPTTHALRLIANHSVHPQQQLPP